MNDKPKKKISVKLLNKLAEGMLFGSREQGLKFALPLHDKMVEKYGKDERFIQEFFQ